MIIAEEISSPIKSSSYDVPSIILSYSVFALEAIVAASGHAVADLGGVPWNPPPLLENPTCILHISAVLIHQES